MTREISGSVGFGAGTAAAKNAGGLSGCGTGVPGAIFGVDSVASAT